jgi:hypothetical protein
MLAGMAIQRMDNVGIVVDGQPAEARGPDRGPITSRLCTPSNSTASKIEKILSISVAIAT